MLEVLRLPVRISRNEADVLGASHLILPGVGAFDHYRQRMRELGVDRLLEKAVLKQRIPLLGICVGMQVLTDGSEEGSEEGLGWIPGFATRLQPDSERKLRVPHMGWNIARPAQPSHPLFADHEDEIRFYFVHSFAVHCKDSKDVLATSEHGVEFASAIGRGSIYGVQFHPEKSHRFGKALLAAFAKVPSPRDLARPRVS